MVPKTMVNVKTKSINLEAKSLGRKSRKTIH